jgi:hypothetical protein
VVVAVVMRVPAAVVPVMSVAVVMRVPIAAVPAVLVVMFLFVFEDG